MRTAVCVTIEDDYGQEFEYTISQLPAGKGLKLGRRIMKAAGKPIAEVLGSISSGAPGSDGAPGPAEIDGAGLGRAIAGLADALLDLGDEKVFKELLTNTTRRPVEGGAPGVKPSDLFDQVYQANYGELAAAIFEVVKANYGPSIARAKRSGNVLAAMFSKIAA